MRGRGDDIPHVGLPEGVSTNNYLSGYYDTAAGQEHVWRSAIVLWWQIYYRSGPFGGNRKKARRETDCMSARLISGRQTYISKGILQSTVRLTRWPLTAKTRVCHWLSARLAPPKPQFSVAPPWPLKRKCRRFLESLSPKMRRPRSFLFFDPVRPPLLSLSSESPCSLLFGSIKVKMYSFRCRSNKS